MTQPCILIQTDETTEERLTDQLKDAAVITNDPSSIKTITFGIWSTPPLTLKQVTLATRRIRTWNPGFQGVVVAPTGDLSTRLKIAESNLTWVAPHELCDAADQVKALLMNHPPPSPILTVGDVTLDPRHFTVTVRHAAPITFTPSEYRIVHALITENPNVVSYEALIKHARLSFTSGPENLKVFVSRIRSRFTNVGVTAFIVGQRGVGYAWRGAEVRGVPPSFGSPLAP